MKPSVKTCQKEIYDKSLYQKARFQNLVQSANWGHFYSQTCAEGMFTVFNNISENALKKCIHRKKVFIRNDKNSLTIFQRWVDTKTRKLNRLIKTDMDPLGQSYKELNRQIIENSHSGRLSHTYKKTRHSENKERSGISLMKLETQNERNLQ